MRRYAILAACAVALSGCYKVSVVSAAAEPAPKITVPWQHSFVFGIVPPAVVNTQTACPQGVGRVTTQRSFVNGLVGVLTWSMYTPIQVDVHCAAR
ncbi:MAG TPA: hypothetical protein VEA99_13475 [Gemmatimonadaceae bacterium]|nr:hypothetical protein [Gemmatimonadaceae bacterium]